MKLTTRNVKVVNTELVEIDGTNFPKLSILIRVDTNGNYVRIHCSIQKAKEIVQELAQALAEYEREDEPKKGGMGVCTSDLYNMAMNSINHGTPEKSGQFCMDIALNSSKTD